MKTWIVTYVTISFFPTALPDKVKSCFHTEFSLIVNTDQQPTACSIVNDL